MSVTVMVWMKLPGTLTTVNASLTDIPIKETLENGKYGGPACATAKSENASKLLIVRKPTPPDNRCQVINTKTFFNVT
ncbi:hypothetical protein QM565_02605 [Geitlerinema splendidum]|nr:hypothetical protein [Geitlerinema splendidum]